MKARLFCWEYPPGQPLPPQIPRAGLPQDSHVETHCLSAASSSFQDSQRLSPRSLLLSTSYLSSPQRQQQESEQQGESRLPTACMSAPSSAASLHAPGGPGRLQTPTEMALARDARRADKQAGGTGAKAPGPRKVDPSRAACYKENILPASSVTLSKTFQPIPYHSKTHRCLPRKSLTSQCHSEAEPPLRGGNKNYARLSARRDPSPFSALLLLPPLEGSLIRPLAM